MAGSFRDLTVYKKAYSLADQIRRSSRSVCRGIGEGYRKRQYPKHFSSKISDADMENSETQISLDFVVDCKYISHDENKDLRAKSEEVGRLLNHMIENPEKYAPRRYTRSI
ncbi:MAG: four helix bundle protein [Flavobacteriales bacterium]|nr:four helix bundle protein [Flavobacteriales bacterium]